MPTLSLGGKVIATQTGSAEPVLASNVSVTQIGKIIKTTVYDIPRGIYSNTPNFTFDDNLPNINEGVQIWSQSYTPSATASKILLRTHFFMFETSNTADACVAAFFIQDTNLAVGMILDAKNETAGTEHAGALFGEYMVDSWTGSKIISIRKGSGHQAVGYWYSLGWSTYAALFDGANNPFGKVIVQEIAA